MRRFFSAPWLLRHAVVLLVVGGMLALGWWQLSRAQDGNTLSIAYAIEWPLFAAFVIGVWIREMRAELRAESASPPAKTEAASRPRPVVVPIRQSAPTEPEDPALTAYNHYLAWLAANPNRRPSEYPGGPLQE